MPADPSFVFATGTAATLDMGALQLACDGSRQLVGCVQAARLYSIPPPASDPDRAGAYRCRSGQAGLTTKLACALCTQWSSSSSSTSALLEAPAGAELCGMEAACMQSSRNLPRSCCQPPRGCTMSAMAAENRHLDVASGPVAEMLARAACATELWVRQLLQVDQTSFPCLLLSMAMPPGHMRGQVWPNSARVQLCRGDTALLHAACLQQARDKAAGCLQNRRRCCTRLQPAFVPSCLGAKNPFW